MTFDEHRTQMASRRMVLKMFLCKMPFIEKDYQHNTHIFFLKIGSEYELLKSLAYITHKNCLSSKFECLLKADMHEKDF